MKIRSKSFIALLEKVGWTKTGFKTKKFNGVYYEYSVEIFEKNNKRVVICEESYFLEITHEDKKWRPAGRFNYIEEPSLSTQLLINAFLEIRLETL
jgi:hypothetical protein